ncbi:hypothetical protein [Amycolatopsis magusensis]|uniref:hypothetical protein n=1 Tax=Amycolatopsis magusensis TaxID=882444 RepID=UPI0037BD5EF9
MNLATLRARPATATPAHGGAPPTHNPRHPSARRDRIERNVRLGRALLTELGLATPFTLDDLLRTSAHRLGTRIDLKYCPFPAGFPRGAAIFLPGDPHRNRADVYLIMVDQHATALVQHSMIAHELAHLLRGHHDPACSRPMLEHLGAPQPRPATAAGIPAAATLLPPPLPAPVLERYFGPADNPDDPIEAEAETIGRMLIAMASFPGAGLMAVHTGHLSDVQRRLAAATDRTNPPPRCWIRV